MEAAMVQEKEKEMEQGIPALERQLEEELEAEERKVMLQLPPVHQTLQFPAHQTPHHGHCRSASHSPVPPVRRLTSNRRQWLPIPARFMESNGLVAVTFSMQDRHGFRYEELTVRIADHGLLLFLLVLLVLALPSWLS